ncbi:hypothetical protein TNIN_3831 [Trichonephila inaurata madagascariensis]|uniref:Uncharacterized protein n=1 Tax=Trichonephila inaurata madagascariensis TaxID=2747483 RepID=A0A8X6XWK0_9ARAC|nr:hypothetical protein TNIN_3831 [Trichonephila inaurata madagascariensis]
MLSRHSCLPRNPSRALHSPRAATADIDCTVCSPVVVTAAPRLIPMRPLKQHLGGKQLADDDGIQHEVLLWMRQQPKEFYAAGIGALIK